MSFLHKKECQNGCTQSKRTEQRPKETTLYAIFGTYQCWYSVVCYIFGTKYCTTNYWYQQGLHSIVTSMHIRNPSKYVVHRDGRNLQSIQEYRTLVLFKILQIGIANTLYSVLSSCTSILRCGRKCAHRSSVEGVIFS